MKQMRRLKRILLEQIKSSAGFPQTILDKDFRKAEEHFLETERSLKRIQGAMAAWIGALDALSSCSQVLAEELARHTILVARPTDPSKREMGTDSATFCRALQGLMSISEKVALPVHDAFIDGALRPLLIETTCNLKPLRDLIDERHKKYQMLRGTKRKTGSHNVVSSSETENNKSTKQMSNAKDDETCSNNSNNLVSVDENTELQSCGSNKSDSPMETSLTEVTEQAIKKLEDFRTSRIKRIPEEIGVILGCQYDYCRRMESEVEQYLPLFPFAACTMVDIANGSSLVKQRIETRRLKKLENDLICHEEMERKIKRHFSANSFVAGSGKYDIQQQPSLILTPTSLANNNSQQFNFQDEEVLPAPSPKALKRYNSSHKRLSSRISQGIKRCTSTLSVRSNDNCNNSNNNNNNSANNISLLDISTLQTKLNSDTGFLAAADDYDSDNDTAHSSWCSSIHKSGKSLSIFNEHDEDNLKEEEDEENDSEKMNVYLLPPKHPMKTSHGKKQTMFYPEMTCPPPVINLKTKVGNTSPINNNNTNLKKNHTNVGFATLHEQFRM